MATKKTIKRRQKAAEANAALEASLARMGGTQLPGDPSGSGAYVDPAVDPVLASVTGGHPLFGSAGSLVNEPTAALPNEAHGGGIPLLRWVLAAAAGAIAWYFDLPWWGILLAILAVLVGGWMLG